jgi:hypothetical protein
MYSAANGHGWFCLRCSAFHRGDLNTVATEWRLCSWHTLAIARNITETAIAAPGYTSVLETTKAPLAATLKLNGYWPAQFGTLRRGDRLADPARPDLPSPRLSGPPIQSVA